MTSVNFRTELVLNMYLDKLTILQHSDLDQPGASRYFDAQTPCQLYFICRRPRVTVAPASFHADRDKISLTFKVHTSKGITDFPFVFENPFKSNLLTFSSDYPYDSFEIGKKDETLLSVKATSFLQSFPQDVTNADFLDMEILYIGQTYPGEGSLGGMLNKHKTLQGIYDAAVNKNPESDIYILLASFQHNNLVLSDSQWRFLPGQDDAQCSKPDLNNSSDSEMVSRVSEQQMTNITEAALTSYFDPPYNRLFKGIYPSPARGTYAGFNYLNLYSISLELDTYGIANCHIYSEKVEPKWLHMKTFLLQSDDDRKLLQDSLSFGDGIF